eukprot:s749_g8.t1
MDVCLEDIGLPERGRLRYKYHPVHKDRHFESGWCMGKSAWMYSYCLGGYDVVFRSMGGSDGATKSYHDDLLSCRAFDVCLGCGTVKLENRAQSGLALVQYMANTGPTAVWLEHPEPHSAKPAKPMPSSPNLQESDKRKMTDSFVGSILTASPLPDTRSSTGHAALKQAIVAKMLENCDVEADPCGQFPLLWRIIQEEMKNSDPELGDSKAALLVLGAACELRLTLSDAQFAVEVPANAFSSLEEYLDEQIADPCLLIPLMECREENKCIGFQHQRLDEIKAAISSRSQNPLKTTPVAPPHLFADAAMLAGMHWLEMEDMAVLHLLRRCGLVAKGSPVDEGRDLHRFGGVVQRKAREGIEERANIELEGLHRLKLHKQRGGISESDEETMRQCLEAGEPLLVCFWPPAKRLRAIMALLNLADLPNGWTIPNVSEVPMAHGFTFADLVEGIVASFRIMWFQQRSLEDPHQRDAEGVRTDEMWHKLLSRLRREDYSKLYAWLARQEDMFHLIQSDQTLLVVEQFGRVNVAKTFCQVAQMVRDRLNNDDFSVELQLELLKFEGSDQTALATSARTHMLKDSWDAFASKSAACSNAEERQGKRARLKGRVSEHDGWGQVTKFVQIKMKDRCGGGAFAIAEWQIFGVPAENLAQGIVPTGSSDSKWGRFAGATDGKNDVLWHAGNGDYPSSLTLNLGVANLGLATSVSGMTLLTPANSPNYGFKSLKIMRSMDGTSWTAVRTDSISQCTAARSSFHPGWPEKTKFVKIEMSERCGGSHFAVVEWQIFGTQDKCKGSLLPEGNDRFPCDSIKDETTCRKSYMKIPTGETFQCGVRKASEEVSNCLVVSECDVTSSLSRIGVAAGDYCTSPPLQATKLLVSRSHEELTMPRRGVVCQLNYHGGGMLRYLQEGLQHYVAFPSSIHPLRVGEDVNFQVNAELNGQLQAVDVTPANRSVLPSVKRQKLDNQMVIPKGDRGCKGKRSAPDGGLHRLQIRTKWS